MAVEFRFSVPDQPGELAKISAALGRESVNIEGCAGLSTDGGAFKFNIVTNNEEGAMSALDKAGIAYIKQEVIMLGLENNPGALATFAERLKEAGINVTSFYVTMDRHQVLGVDKINEAKSIASELGVS